MHFVLISILCSVSVAVLLKFARKSEIDTWQMVVWNYPIAVVLTYLLFPPAWPDVEDAYTMPWHIYLPAWILMPTLFVVLSKSLRYAGLVQTEVAQRISLVLSLLAAAFLFNELFTATRILGILVGFAAVACLIGWRRDKQAVSGWKKVVLPLMVFVGYATMDILFKLVALEGSMPYTTSMFIMFFGAMTGAWGFLIWQLVRRSIRFSGKAAIWGLGLGALNFGNILFYMKAHRALSDSPSIVFTGMNIGVIALGTLVGVWLFKEKLSAINVVGIILALASVLMIAYL